MSFIDWTDDFQTDIQSIDDQHRVLVEIVNKFDDNASKGKGSQIMNEILSDLIQYTNEHFSYEESLMEEAQYNKFKQHKSQHRQLIERIEKLQYGFNNKGMRITKEVREFLKFWLVNHILKEDKAYASALAEKV